MKVAALATLALLVHGDLSHELLMQRARAPAPGPAAAPGAGPSPAPVDNTVKTKDLFVNEVVEHLKEEVKENPEDFVEPTPTILGWEVEFKIENYNYFDLNKALTVPSEPEEEPKAQKLVQPAEIVQKDPKFWSREAVVMSHGKGIDTAAEFPKKILPQQRETYPVDLSDGMMSSTKTAETQAVEKESKDSEKTAEKVAKIEVKAVESAAKVDVKAVEPAAKVEVKAAESTATAEVTPEESKAKVDGKSAGEGGSSWAKTKEQFGDFVSGDSPSHDKDGKLYPVSLGSLIQLAKSSSGVGRCLTEEGMFEDTCVVDVLRDAVKGAFVDLIETVLDTPAERQDLLDWFGARQAKKHDKEPPVFVAVRQHLLRRVAPAAAVAAAPVSADASGAAPAPGGPIVEKAMQGKVGTGTAGTGVAGVEAPAAAAAIEAAAGPAAAVAEKNFQADVFVQFYPGQERPVVEDGDTGRSIVTKVWIRGAPNTGVFELAPWIEGVLKRHEEDGLLQILIQKRLFEATGIAPKIDGITDIQLDAKTQWSLDTCEGHMKKMMREFSKAYTRRMVPTAIYNECTNFVSEVSFSHDRIFDAHDRIKCRHATVKLAKAWNFGQGHQPAKKAESEAGPAPAPAPSVKPAKAEIDYKGFCSNVCEIKYGTDAPTCHVTEGKDLFNAAP